MKTTIIRLATLLCAALVSQTLSAAVMLAGGLTHEHQLQPGGRVTGILNLRNTSNQTEEIKIYQADVRVNGDGSTDFIAGTGGHQRSNASWISLATDRVILPPGGSQQVSYSLQVPANPATQGSYWSTLMLEPVAMSHPDSQLRLPDDRPNVKIQQKIRYAVRVLSHVGSNGQANLTFTPPKINKDEQGQRWFNVDIRNTGNQFSRADVWLDVFHANGQQAGRFKAEARSLYVGERKDFAINIARLTPGKYKALLAAEDNQTGQIFGSDINLSINP